MPFGLLVKWIYPLFGGLYPIGKEGHIYVSPGTGTWGPPIRLGASPEITLIDILPEPGSVSGNPILPKSKTAR
jgi:predicted MPP superfamily phosphohydrolase